MSNDGVKGFPWLLAGIVLLALMVFECSAFGVLHTSTQVDIDALANANNAKAVKSKDFGERLAEAGEAKENLASLKSKVSEMESLVDGCGGSDLVAAFEPILSRETGALRGETFEVGELRKDGCRFEFEGSCSSSETLKSIVSTLSGRSEIKRVKVSSHEDVEDGLVFTLSGVMKSNSKTDGGQP